MCLTISGRFFLHIFKKKFQAGPGKCESFKKRDERYNRCKFAIWIAGKAAGRISERKTLYPAFLDIRDKKCVVVGGGEVAARKTESLLECGALVTVVSPALNRELSRLARAGAISWKEAHYRKTSLRGTALVIAATDDEKINGRVYRDAKEAGALVNVVDVPELCDYYVPSVIRRGGVTIAIGTGGGSPILSREIRRRLEAEIGPEYGELLELMSGWRAAVRDGIASQPARKQVWEKIVGSRALALLAEGKTAEATETVARIVNSSIGAAQAGKSEKSKASNRKSSKI